MDSQPFGVVVLEGALAGLSPADGESLVSDQSPGAEAGITGEGFAPEIGEDAFAIALVHLNRLLGEKCHG